MEPLKDFVRQIPINQGDLKKPKPLTSRLELDPILLVLILILMTVGLLVLYSASSKSLGTVYKQGVFLSIGFIAMVVLSRMPLELIRTWTPVIYIFGCFLLVIVLAIGVGAKGAQRWINLGFIRFQPSELVKLSVPMLVAWYLAKQNLPPKFKDICVVIMIILLPAGLIVVQPDLGTSLLVSAAGFFVLWLGGLSWRYIAAAVSLLVASAYPLWHFFLRDYQRQRILTLLDPESDKLGAGWNIIQSKTAIGSGGKLGKGWLEGTQSQLDFLPESHTDFIIAVLAEEHGFVGVAAIVCLYFLITMRGLYISWRANNVFAQLLGGAITLTFFVYVLVNMGMVSGVFPIVGVPLPLVSQGGTSVVSLFLGFGILMLIARQNPKVEEK